ncbi:hypothetical protein AgCh_028650 [Apium graveolens]
MASHQLPAKVARMLNDNGIKKVKLFDANDTTMNALTSSDIKVMVAIPSDHLVVEPHHSYTSTAVKDPGTASKERPRHQKLSFGARRRGSPSLGLGAPEFTFINKLLKESIYLTFVVVIVEKWQDQESILLEDHLLVLRDARSLIELNQYKYTNVPVAEEHMANLTSDELAEVIRLYRQEQIRLQEEAELEEEPEESGDSQQSKRFVFDQIGAKGKKSKKD